MDFKRILGITLLAGSLLLPLSAQTVNDLSRQTELNEWQLKTVDSGWHDTTLPSRISGREENSLYSFELQTKVTLSGSLKGEDIYLMTGRMANGSSSYYLNGVRLYRNGLTSPRYQFQGGIEKGILLPPSLIKYDGDNTVQIRYVTDNPSLKVAMPSIGGYNDALIQPRGRNFLNVKIYSYFAFISLFIALFFMLQYMMKREIRYNLLFALANLCMSFYFYRIAIIPDALPFTRFYSISKGALSPSVAFYALFFIDFFQFKVKRIIPIAILTISGLAAFSVALIPSSYHETEGLFTLSLLPILIWIFMMLWYSIKAIRRNKSYARVLFIGVLLAVGFGTHDIVCMLSGYSPYAWVQGIGIFSLTIAMFISLAMSAVKAQIAIEFSEKEIREKNDNLKDYVNHIRNAYTSLSHVQTSLGESMKDADRTITNLSQNTLTMSHKMKVQGKDIETILTAFNEIISSFTMIFSSLDNQNRELDETFAIMEQMLANIQELTDGFKESVEFSRSLNETTSRGEESMNVSQESIKKVREGSKVINELLETIGAVADNTNLLAMNAAIEAAHAGAAGKGFSVVADEIKSLSEQSTDRIDEVSDNIKTINDRIRDGAEKNEEVQAILEEISKKADGSAKQLDQLYQNLLEQKTATESIQHSMTQLKDAAKRIYDSAEDQNKSGQTIRSNIKLTTQTLEDSHSLVNRIGSETGNMVQVFEKVRHAFNEGTEISKKLEELLKKEI